MKKLLIALVSVLVIGASSVYLTTKEDKEELTTQSNSESQDNTTEASNIHAGQASAAKGDYVTLAEYDKNPAVYAGKKKIYFFHASWCPICKQIDKDISANPAVIPEGVTLIKTDFDSSTSLRQKYAVSTQYTFVQVDEQGNELKQWSAPNIEDAVKEILL
jgi:thiol-disulfide isomerase/thioredoxin